MTANDLFQMKRAEVARREMREYDRRPEVIAEREARLSEYRKEAARHTKGAGCNFTGCGPKCVLRKSN